MPEGQRQRRTDRVRENGVGSGVLGKWREAATEDTRRSGWFGWNVWPAGEVISDGVRDERVKMKGNGRQFSHRLRSKVHLDQGEKDNGARWEEEKSF